MVRLHPRSPSGLRELGGIPGNAGAVARERASARRGWRRRPRGRGPCCRASCVADAAGAGCRSPTLARAAKSLATRARAARDFHATAGMCQSLGGARLDRAVAAAFLEAVTPAGVRACAEAIGEIEARHAERVAGRRLAVERATFETERRQRQFDACEPENRLVARTLEARLEESLAALERERRTLAELEQRQPRAALAIRA